MGARKVSKPSHWPKNASKKPRARASASIVVATSARPLGFLERALRGSIEQLLARRPSPQGERQSRRELVGRQASRDRLPSPTSTRKRKLGAVSRDSIA